MENKINSKAYLDGIRGIAAFGVFLNHYALAFYYAFWTQQMQGSHMNGFEIKYAQSCWSFITNGGFDVSIFFVLSGFVLSRKFFRSGNTEDVISGLHRRFIRLYVPIAFTLLLSYILFTSHLYRHQEVSQVTLSLWFVQLWPIWAPVKQLFSALGYSVMFNGDASFDTVLWTISTELYGSLFVFAFLLFTNYTRRFRLLLVCLIMYYFFTTGSPFYMDFVLGITLCYTEKWLEERETPVYNIMGVPLLAAALMCGSFIVLSPAKGSWLYAFGTNFWNYIPWAHTIGAYLLVLSFMISPVLQKMVSFSLFRLLGYISFSLYLLHPLVMGSFSSWLFLKCYHGAQSYNTAALIVFGATIAVLLPLSWLMTRYIDQPGIRLARKVYELLRKPERTPLPVQAISVPAETVTEEP